MTRGVRIGIGAAFLVCALVMLLTPFSPLRPSSSAATPVLTLLVNGSESIEVAPGTPLVFKLTLSGDRRGKITVGSTWRPWYSMMQLRNSDAGALPWQVVTHGEPRAMNVTLVSGEPPTISTAVSPVADVDWQRSEHTVWLAASPDDTQQLSGTTRIHAVLDAPWWAWSAGKEAVRSLDATIRVPADAGTRADLKRQQLRESTEFFLARREFDRAYAAAKEFAQLEPGSATAHVMNGDALAGLNRRAEALVAYRRALTLSKTSYEEPTALLERIAGLERTP